VCDIRKPAVRATYELEPISEPDIAMILKDRLKL